MRWPLALFLTACSAAPALDAGSDAPRRNDAGFSAEALAPCPVDPAHAFDGRAQAAYVRRVVSPTAARLFYPLAVLEGAALVPPDLLAARRAAEASAAACDGEAACVRDALGFDEAEADGAGEAVRAALGGSLGEAAAELRAAGDCALLDRPDDGAFVAACVRTTLLELSRLSWLGQLAPAALDALTDEIAAGASTRPFFDGLTRLVEEGLALARRDEAIRYEPLDEENRAALEALAATDFDAYPFVAIVVPGQGPTDASTALNPAGRARADLAWERWQAAMAPVILLSGGHVHPDRTPFSEAIEMRRHLVEERGVPASAILVDPYARHTTTNLRNATRILVRAGVPTDRPILVTSDLVQSTYIRSRVYAERCDEELGYRPFVDLTMLSPFDACLLPAAASLHAAPSDPLDP
jgi:hypothetical protein